MALFPISKRTFILLCAFGVTIIIGYFTFAMRGFYVSGRLEFDDGVPEQAKEVVESWYSQNRQFGRIAIDADGVLYAIQHPLGQRQIASVNVQRVDDTGGTPFVIATFYDGDVLLPRLKDFVLRDGVWQESGDEVGF